MMGQILSNALFSLYRIETTMSELFVRVHVSTTARAIVTVVIEFSLIWR